VVTAGFDPLTDAAKLYVGRLRDAGVPVTHAHHPDTFHGFLSIRFFPQRRAALRCTSDFVRERITAGSQPDGPRVAAGSTRSAIP